MNRKAGPRKRGGRGENVACFQPPRTGQQCGVRRFSAREGATSGRGPREHGTKPPHTLFSGMRYFGENKVTICIKKIITVILVYLRANRFRKTSWCRSNGWEHGSRDGSSGLAPFWAGGCRSDSFRQACPMRVGRQALQRNPGPSSDGPENCRQRDTIWNPLISGVRLGQGIRLTATPFEGWCFP